MEIGLGLGFRVFIVTFRAGFDGFLFISLALAVGESIVNLDRSRSMSISLWNLTGHHATGKKKGADLHPDFFREFAQIPEINRGMPPVPYQEFCPHCRGTNATSPSSRLQMHSNLSAQGLVD